MHRFVSLTRLFVIFSLMGSANGASVKPTALKLALLQSCLIKFRALAHVAREWTGWSKAIKSPTASQPIIDWAEGAQIIKNLVHLREPKNGLETVANFYVPETDEQTIRKFEKEVIPKTIGFLMTKDWYKNKEAPFHVYVRIGDRVFRITTQHKIVEQSYSNTLRELLARDGSSGPIPETREMVFTVSDTAKKALLEYF